jgi:hypothetical protein
MGNFMSKILIIYFILICFETAGYSQNDSLSKYDKPFSFISLNVGLNDFHVRDKYISPYAFSGFIFVSKIDYQIKMNRNNHFFRLLFSTGGINSDIQLRDVNQFIGNISYVFSHEIDSWNISGNPFCFFIGTGISTYFQYTTVHEESRQNNSISYDDSWYVSHSINLHLYGEYKFSQRENISILITSPVAGFVTRPANGHYLNLDNSNIIEKDKLKLLTGGRLEFLWDNLVILTDIEYRTPLSERFNFHAAYSFGYTSSDSPAPLLSTGMYMNSILVGLDWFL